MPNLTPEQLDALSERPLAADELANLPRVPRIKTLRRALQLTEQQFCDAFCIPVETIRDWEAGVSEPDAVAQAYLLLIAREPGMVAAALVPRGGG